jgi:uncharacterized membrane protein (DUF441 family)
MQLRILTALGGGVLVGVLGTAGVRLWAEQNHATPAMVVPPHGFVAEEVRVGGSCVVIVSTTGPRQIAVVPCGH